MKLNFLLILFLLVGCTVARDGYSTPSPDSNYRLVCRFEDTPSCKICQIKTSQTSQNECRLTGKETVVSLDEIIAKAGELGIKPPQKIRFLPLDVALDLTKLLLGNKQWPIYQLKTLKTEEILKKQNNPNGLELFWQYKITKGDSPKQVAMIDQQCPGLNNPKEFCRYYKGGKTYYYLRRVVIQCDDQGEKCVAKLAPQLSKENQAQTPERQKPQAKTGEQPTGTDNSKSNSEVKQPTCGNDCYQVELVIHQRSFLEAEGSQASLPSDAFFRWPEDNTETQRFVNNKKNLKFQVPHPKKDTDIDSWLKQEYGIIPVTPSRYRLVYQTYKQDSVNQRQLRLNYLWQDTTDKVLLVYYPVQPETSYRTGLEVNLIHQMDLEFQKFLALVQGCWSYLRIYIRFTDLGRPVPYTESNVAAYLFKPAYESKDYAWSEQRVLDDYETLIKNQGSQIDILYFSAESPSQLKKQFALFEQTKTKVYVFTTGYSEKSPSDSPYLQIRLLDKTRLTVSEITEIFNHHPILDFFSGGK